MPANAPITGSGNQASAFARTLVGMSADEIRRLARLVRASDDVGWWEAVVAVDRQLRRAHLLRRAALAGRAATQAVLIGAGRNGMDTDPDVIAVARAADDAARALMAGGGALAEAMPLLAGWAEVGLLPVRVAMQARFSR